jgi:copper(I)-binding protein
MLAAAMLGGLAACSDRASAPAEAAASAEAAPAAGASATMAGLTISNARLVLAPVSGNPAAAYFDLSYSGAGSVTLADVAVDSAAMAVIHDMSEENGVMRMTDAGVIELREGAPVSFAPGALHVMVIEPSTALKPGGTAKLTVSLSNGTFAAIDVPVRAAGEER